MQYYQHKLLSFPLETSVKCWLIISITNRKSGWKPRLSNREKWGSSNWKSNVVPSRSNFCHLRDRLCGSSDGHMPFAPALVRQAFSSVHTAGGHPQVCSEGLRVPEKLLLFPLPLSPQAFAVSWSLLQKVHGHWDFPVQEIFPSMAKILGQVNTPNL